MRTSSTERSAMPLRAAIAWRRKLSTLTPGISSGCWKPRNMPRAARWSVGRSVTSSPSKRIAPDVTRYAGSPSSVVGERRLAGAVRAHERVDLARADGERDAAQDLVAVDGDVQVVDLEERGPAGTAMAPVYSHYPRSEKSEIRRQEVDTGGGAGSTPGERLRRAASPRRRHEDALGFGAEPFAHRMRRWRIRTGWPGARGLRQAPCVSTGSIYWWSEGTLQSAIVLNGHESDGGRDDRTP